MTAAAAAGRFAGPCVAAWLAAASPAVADDNVVAGFDLCVRPLRPSCVTDPSTYAAKTSLDACRAEVDRFLTLTVAYRQCMTTKIGDALLQLNNALDHIKCGSPTTVKCLGPTDPTDPQKMSRNGPRTKP